MTVYALKHRTRGEYFGAPLIVNGAAQDKPALTWSTMAAAILFAEEWFPDFATAYDAVPVTLPNREEGTDA